MGISIGNTNILFIYLFILWEINIGKLTHGFSWFWACLISQLKLTFSHFKQFYTYFNTLFHSHIYQKYSNDIIQTSLPNGTQNHCVILSSMGPNF